MVSRNIPSHLCSLLQVMAGNCETMYLSLAALVIHVWVLAKEMRCHEHKPELRFAQMVFRIIPSHLCSLLQVMAGNCETMYLSFATLFIHVWKLAKEMRCHEQ